VVEIDPLKEVSRGGARAAQQPVHLLSGWSVQAAQLFSDVLSVCGVESFKRRARSSQRMGQLAPTAEQRLPPLAGVKSLLKTTEEPGMGCSPRLIRSKTAFGCRCHC
jgi:hypothetical protein